MQRAADSPSSYHSSDSGFAKHILRPPVRHDKPSYRLFPSVEPTPPASPVSLQRATLSRAADFYRRRSSSLDDTARLAAARQNVAVKTVAVRKGRKVSLTELKPMSTVQELPSDSPTVPVRYSVLPRTSEETSHGRSSSAPGEYLRDSQTLPVQHVHSTESQAKPAWISRQAESHPYADNAKGLGLTLPPDAQLLRPASQQRSPRPKPNLRIEIKNEDRPPPPPPKSPRHHSRNPSAHSHASSRVQSPVSEIATRGSVMKAALVDTPNSNTPSHEGSQWANKPSHLREVSDVSREEVAPKKEAAAATSTEKAAPSAAPKPPLAIDKPMPSLPPPSSRFSVQRREAEGIERDAEGERTPNPTPANADVQKQTAPTGAAPAVKQTTLTVPKKGEAEDVAPPTPLKVTGTLGMPRPTTPDLNNRPHSPAITQEIRDKPAAESSQQRLERKAAPKLDERPQSPDASTQPPSSGLKQVPPLDDRSATSDVSRRPQSPPVGAQPGLAGRPPGRAFGEIPISPDLSRRPQSPPMTTQPSAFGGKPPMRPTDTRPFSPDMGRRPQSPPMSRGPHPGMGPPPNRYYASSPPPQYPGGPRTPPTFQDGPYPRTQRPRAPNDLRAGPPPHGRPLGPPNMQRNPGPMNRGPGPWNGPKPPPSNVDRRPQSPDAELRPELRNQGTVQRYDSKAASPELGKPAQSAPLTSPEESVSKPAAIQRDRSRTPTPDLNARPQSPPNLLRPVGNEASKISQRTETRTPTPEPQGRPQSPANILQTEANSKVLPTLPQDDGPRASTPDVLSKAAKAADLSNPLQTIEDLAKQSEALHARYASLRADRLKLSTSISAGLREQKAGPEYANMLLDQHLSLNAINSSMDICFAKLKSLDCRKEEAIDAFIQQTKAKLAMVEDGRPPTSMTTHSVASEVAVEPKTLSSIIKAAAGSGDAGRLSPDVGQDVRALTTEIGATDGKEAKSSATLDVRVAKDGEASGKRDTVIRALPESHALDSDKPSGSTTSRATDAPVETTTKSPVDTPSGSKTDLSSKPPSQLPLDPEHDAPSRPPPDAFTIAAFPAPPPEPPTITSPTTAEEEADNTEVDSIKKTKRIRVKGAKAAKILGLVSGRPESPGITLPGDHRRQAPPPPAAVEVQVIHRKPVPGSKTATAKVKSPLPPPPASPAPTRNPPPPPSRQGTDDSFTSTAGSEAEIRTPRESQEGPTPTATAAAGAMMMPAGPPGQGQQRQQGGGHHQGRGAGQKPVWQTVQVFVEDDILDYYGGKR